MLSFTDQWSDPITYPYSGSSFKCCEYKKQLFIFSAIRRYGYIFDHDTETWIKITVEDETSVRFLLPESFSLFSYNNHIFIKGGF